MRPEDTAAAGGDDAAQAKPGLLDRIDAYLRQLAPHAAEREGAVLLREAAEENRRLREESDRLCVSATYWSGEARRYQRLYDEIRP